MRLALLLVCLILNAGLAFSDVSLSTIREGNYSPKRFVCGTKVSVEQGTLYMRTIVNKFYGAKCDDNHIAKYKILDCKANKCFVLGEDDLSAIETIGNDILLIYKNTKTLLINHQNINVDERRLNRRLSMSSQSWFQGPKKILSLLTHNYCINVQADVCHVTSYECYDAKLSEASGVVYAACDFTRYAASENTRR